MEVKVNGKTYDVNIDETIRYRFSVNIDGQEFELGAELETPVRDDLENIGVNAEAELMKILKDEIGMEIQSYLDSH